MTASLPLKVLPAAVAAMVSVATPTQLADPTLFSVDKAHSNVGFKARHLGILSVNGRFSEYDATLTVDPEDLATLQATATIQIASIDTGVDRRDSHLKSADFFDAENHPTMTFVSTGVSNVDGQSFDLAGDLTIRGTTKPIVLKGNLLGVVDFMGKQRVALEAIGTLNRFDYGLQWNSLTEAGGLVVSEKIQIILEIEAVAD